MTTTKIAGRSGRVEVGGVPLTCDTWAVTVEEPLNMEEFGRAFEDFKQQAPAIEMTFGGYWIDGKVMHAFRKIDAFNIRRERKRWKRYQRQKRKQ